MAIIRLVLLSAALAGCAGGPVGSGGRDEVLFAGAETIRFLWDPQRTSEGRVRAEAKAYCNGRDVDQVEPSAPAGAAGALRATTWRCKAATGSGAAR